MRINQYKSTLNNTSSYNASATNPGLKNVSFDGWYSVAKNSVKTVANKATGKGTDYLAHGFGRLVSLKPVQSLVNWLKNKNYEEHLAAFVGCVISACYMMDTAKSKTIEKDQKMPLIMNQGIVCGLSTVGAYTLNRYLNKKLNGLTETFHISQINNKALQEDFLKCKADYGYVDTLKDKLKNNVVLKNLFNNNESKFEFNNTIKVYLKEALKKNPDDKVAIKFLEDIKSIKPTATRDKADIIKELFLSLKDKSKAIQSTYNRASMNIAIGNLAGLEKKANSASELAKFAGEELAEMTKLKGGRLTNMMNGFRIAKALMVFALVYRFISPVFATPVANKISEKIENHKKSA